MLYLELSAANYKVFVARRSITGNRRSAHGHAEMMSLRP
jgi:hypothetical protein